ncbi:hypothetical protein BKA80DRAFT_264132 [Phyllosticta citrichinensis]
MPPKNDEIHMARDSGQGTSRLIIRHGWREGPLLSRRDPGATTSTKPTLGETAGGEGALERGENGGFGGKPEANMRRKFALRCRNENGGLGRSGIRDGREAGRQPASQPALGAGGRVCGVVWLSRGWCPENCVRAGTKWQKIVSEQSAHALDERQSISKASSVVP